MLATDAVPLGTRTPDFWLRWLLPLLLIALSVLVVGSHYESNDDTLLTYIISDYATTSRLPVLHQTYVFWIGASEILSRLYHAAPGVPWYGLTLYVGLYLAVVLSFGLLLRTALRPASARVKLLGLSLFFGFFFLEHILFFNFTRIAILLGATALLRVIYDLAYFRERPVRLVLPLLALALGFSVRHASIGLALILIGLPGLVLAFRLDDSRPRLLLRGSLILGVMALVSGVSYSYNHFYHGLILNPPELYNKFLSVFDYHNYFFHENLSVADKWRAAAVQYWVCGDAEAYDATFFERVGGFNLGRYLRETVPFRISEFININLNYLGQWALLAALVWWISRTSTTPRARWLVLGAVTYFLGLLGAMMLLKLPHRIISPAISIAALALLPMARGLPLSEPAFWRRRAVLGLLIGAGLFHLGRVGVRSRKYHRLRTENETHLADYNARYGGKLVVQAAPGEFYFYLNPLRAYDLHRVRRVPLDSWTTAFEWFAEHCRTETGATTWAGALQAAARQPDTRWLMSPPFADFLRQYLHHVHHLEIQLEPTVAAPLGPGTPLAEYRATFTAPPAAADAPQP